MRAWIILAGILTKEDIDFYRTIKPHSTDLVICADGGYDNCVLFGFRTDIVIGDMDSVKSTIPLEVKTLKFPKDKDKTDSELCIDYALEQGATEIIILGNLNGKFSHTLANIMLLKYIGKSAESMILSSKERISIINNEEQNISRGDDKYFSLIPLTNCEGVTIQNAKYEIKDKKIPLGFTHLISNEFTSQSAKISVKQGELLIITEK